MVDCIFFLRKFYEKRMYRYKDWITYLIMTEKRREDVTERKLFCLRTEYQY